jgi:hypothetical protein
MQRPRWKKVVRVIALGLLGALAIAQVVPYGRAHSNPPIVAEPAWDQPATRALADRACFDCHSNQTRWPWYSFVAPTSWLVQNHVDEGRDELNFSAWTGDAHAAREASEVVLDGSMPPRSYTLLHPEARLSAAERSELARGLEASLAAPHASR